MVFVSLLFTGLVSQADIIKCHFTEPFISTQYSTTTNELVFDSADSDFGLVTEKNVSFQIKGSALFELVSKDGKVLMKLTLNHKGSDGMSDVVYPYDAEYLRDGHSLFGGCSSNFLKADRSRN